MGVKVFKKGGGVGIGAEIYKDLPALKASSKNYQNGQLITLSDRKGIFTFDKNDTASAEDGGTVFVDNQGRRIKRSFDLANGVFPDFFGAVGDGVVNDQPAIQKAVDLAAAIGSVVKFTFGKVYKVDSSIVLPKNLLQSSVITLVGYGSQLKTTLGISIISRVPVDQDEASVAVSKRVVIKGLQFKGSKAAGSKGIDLAATYGSKIEDCSFERLAVGIDLRFALMTAVNHCTATDCTKAFVIRTGDWPFATLTNSQSNNTIFHSPRVYNAPDGTSIASFEINGCSGIRLYSPIIEGGNPQYGVLFDFQNSTVVKDFYVDSIHLECTPSLAGLAFRNSNFAQVFIDKIFSQYACTMVDTDTCGGNWTMFVANIPYVVTGTKFKGTGTKWRFNDCEFGNLTGGITATTSWVDGLRPNLENIYDIRGTTASNAIFNSYGVYHSFKAPNQGQISVDQLIATIKGYNDVLIETPSPNAGKGNITLKGQVIKLQGNLTTNKSEAPAGVVGAIVKRMPIYDDTRTLLGYIPIYDGV